MRGWRAPVLLFVGARGRCRISGARIDVERRRGIRRACRCGPRLRPGRGVLMPMGLEFAPRSPWSPLAALLLAVGLLGGAHGLWQRHALLAKRAAAVAHAEALQPPLHPQRSSAGDALRA